MAGMLCDAGPLIALIDPDDPNHDRCRSSLPNFSLPLITTWPAFTEAAYFLHRSGGWPHQEHIWGFVEDETLELHVPSPAEVRRMRELMEQYRDIPMDLADASLVATAETRRLRRIFTLDSHFRAYRLRDGSAFEVVPPVE